MTLSERNLLTLLVKLRQHPSECTIFGRYAYRDGTLLDDVVLAIRSETDEVHYEGREPPGAMHPATEAYLVASAMVLPVLARRHRTGGPARDLEPGDL